VHAIANLPVDVFKANLPLRTATVIAAMVTILALVLTARQMARIEIARKVT